jgi:hypothetical protein
LDPGFIQLESRRVVNAADDQEPVRRSQYSLAQLLLLVTVLGLTMAIAVYNVHLTLLAYPAIIGALAGHWRSGSRRGWLVFVPIGWFFVLDHSGVGSDFVAFSLSTAWGLTAGTILACGALAYSLHGWWRLAALPLWCLLLSAIVVLWYWNV